MFQEELKMTGALKIEVFNPDGSVKETRDIKNLVVTTGKAFIASRMVGAAANVISHMAIGTGTTAAAAGDTTLETEVARVGVSSGTASGAVATYVATFPAGTGTAAITEAGLLNAASAGTLLCRTVFPVVNKGANDAMTVTWTVTVS